MEGALRAMLVGYALAIAGSAVGAVVLGTSVWRSRRRRERAGWRAKGLLLSVTVLLSLAVAETAAAAWTAWLHRMPALPTTFDPPDGAEHLVVIGGSGALGHPYSPNVSIGQVVAWGLERSLSGRRFRADVLAELGASLTDQHKKLATVRQRPVAVIVYAGHNEFTGRFEEERSVDLDEAPANVLLHRLYRVSLGSPLCRLIYESLSKNRLDGPPPMTRHHRLIDTPMFTPSEAADVVDNFRRRLEAIAVWAERVGAVPILIVEPGDEAGYPPNRSLLPASASAEERRWVEDQYRAARNEESITDGTGSERLYREMIAREPGFAEAHFRLARCLEQSGRHEDALEHYVAARDLDGMPFRCITAFGDVHRDVAARHPRCLLIDGPAVLRRICSHGIVDGSAMQDGHHASLRGIAAISREVLAQLRGRGAFGWIEGDIPQLDPADVATRFGLDRSRWMSVCDWGRTFYRWVAGFRFDPTEHVANAERFEASGRRIAAGESRRRHRVRPAQPPAAAAAMRDAPAAHSLRPAPASDSLATRHRRGRSRAPREVVRGTHDSAVSTRTPGWSLASDRPLHVWHGDRGARSAKPIPRSDPRGHRRAAGRIQDRAERRADARRGHRATERGPLGDSRPIPGRGGYRRDRRRPGIAAQGGGSTTGVLARTRWWAARSGGLSPRDRGRRSAGGRLRPRRPRRPLRGGAFAPRADDGPGPCRRPAGLSRRDGPADGAPRASARIPAEDEFVRRLGPRPVGAVHPRPRDVRHQRDRADPTPLRRRRHEPALPPAAAGDDGRHVAARGRLWARRVGLVSGAGSGLRRSREGGGRRQGMDRRARKAAPARRRVRPRRRPGPHQARCLDAVAREAGGRAPPSPSQGPDVGLAPGLRSRLARRVSDDPSPGACVARRRRVRASGPREPRGSANGRAGAVSDPGVSRHHSHDQLPAPRP